jgi:anti-sigma-K factor RskA
MTLDTPEDRSAAAGEYVLGTLAAEEASRFETTMAQDAGLRSEVAFWQDRLLHLTTRCAPAEKLPQGGWQRLDARLSLPPAPPQQVRRPTRAAVEVPWWRQLGLWQGFSGLAVTAAIVMGAALLVRETAQTPPEIRYVAVLADPAGRGNGWMVEMKQVAHREGNREGSRQGQLRLVPLRPDYDVPKDRVLQFWTKAPGAAGPSSLGLVLPGQVTALPLQQVPNLQPDQLFEITLEPPGGSTIGRPTGPILYIGRAVQLGT